MFGPGGISIWQLLIILVIIVLLFGTKKLKNLGSDLGSAVKGFKGAMSEEEKAQEQARLEKQEQEQEKVIDGEPSKPDKERQS